MTSATSPSNFARRGFTLVELLVVIGIILVIAGIALPMLIKAYSQSDKSKARADLNTIAVCLEAYKQDHGDYPRTNGVDGTGAAVLCKALVGPGNALPTTTAWSAGTIYNPGDVVENLGAHYLCIQTTVAATVLTDTARWQLFSDGDGLDGPGWRTRQGAKPQAAYLNTDRFKVTGMMLANRDGKVILYAPARPTRPELTTVFNAGGSPAGSLRGNHIDVPGQNVTITSPATATVLAPMYDFTDILGTITNSATNLQKMRALFGDANFNGRQDSGETLFTGPYILWASGPDGTYLPATTGKSDVQTCDDVTNFDR
jgi:prepilin-type N-terminal cleavage/methylation domain-containing protein